MGKKVNLTDAGIVFLDLETSSLKPDAEILAIGGLITNKDLEIIEKFDFLIKPKNLSKADLNSLKIIGYSPEKWKEAKELKDVLNFLYPKFQNKILAGWVSHFDWARLEKAFYENGFDDPFDYRKIDIFSLAVSKFGLKNMSGKETLTKICKFLNIPRGKNHTAYDDAFAAYQVFLKLTETEHKKITNRIILYTDGGSINNPGRSAIGVVIKLNEKIKEYGKEIGVATNNEAEYSAIIFGLDKIKQLLGKEKCKNSLVIIYTDSKVVGNQIKGEYKITEKRLFPYFVKVFNLKKDFGKVEIEIIPRKKNLAHKLVEKTLSTRFTQLFKK